MSIYPALLEPQPEGGYTVTFPDLAGCITEGDTIQEAMEMAGNALDSHLSALHANRLPVPEPGDPTAFAAPPGGFVALVQASPPDNPPVRLNITLGQGLLQRIDTTAKREGLTRSGLLANAARDYLLKLDKSA